MPWLGRHDNGPAPAKPARVTGKIQQKTRLHERLEKVKSQNLGATERHLSYWITEYYLPPDTGERALP